METRGQPSLAAKPAVDAGEAVVNKARIAERAASLLLVGFDGTAATDVDLAFMKSVAGVVLFARNVSDGQQTASLVAALQESTKAAGRAPLIVAIDEEGGTVSRISRIGTSMPSAMALGAAGDTGLTRSAYAAIGEELTALGCTLDLAPVADSNTNPRNPVIGVRSFGDAQTAAAHVIASIEGLHDAGIAATAKHFPGHGDASVDSHRDLPVIDAGLDRLRAIELAPFRAAVAASVDVIMMAHVSVPSLEPSGAPATLSRAILSLLRDELGFDGVICTDAMEMEAIASRYPAGEAAVRAIEAGADLITYSSSHASAKEAMVAIRDAILEERIDAANVARSLERIEQLRNRAQRGGDITLLGAERHREIAASAARRAITLVRDPQSVIPLAVREGDRIFVVEFAGATSTPVESDGKHTTLLGALLDKRSAARVQEQVRSLDPAGHEYKQLLMAAGSATAIVAVTRRAWQHPLQAQAVVDLALAGKPLVVVAAREPYDANVAPPTAAVIAAYGDNADSMEAVAAVLVGAATPSGRLPVALDEADTAAPRAAR